MLYYWIRCKYFVKIIYFYYNILDFYVDLLDIAGCITRLHWIACIYPRNIGEFKQPAFILQYFVLA